MIRGSLAKRYARALMAIGQEQGVYERLGKELDELAGAALADESFRLLLKAPVVSKEVREGVIEKLCQELGYHQVSLQFLKLLNGKGRLPFLEQIAEAYRELADEAEGRVRAEVIAATPLEGDALNRVKDALAKITGKQVLMEVEVDQGLIGGVVARVAGKLLDGSVRTQLKAVEERLKTTGAV